MYPFVRPTCNTQDESINIFLVGFFFSKQYEKKVTLSVVGFKIADKWLCILGLCVKKACLCVALLWWAPDWPTLDYDWWCDNLESPYQPFIRIFAFCYQAEEHLLFVHFPIQDQVICCTWCISSSSGDHISTSAYMNLMYHQVIISIAKQDHLLHLPKKAFFSVSPPQLSAEGIKRWFKKLRLPKT